MTPNDDRAVDDPDPESGDGSELEDGRGPGALEGFITDITERKERERELRRSQRRFEAIFEDPNLLVALLGVDGTVEDVNRPALKSPSTALDSRSEPSDGGATG